MLKRGIYTFAKQCLTLCVKKHWCAVIAPSFSDVLVHFCFKQSLSSDSSLSVYSLVFLNLIGSGILLVQLISSV